LSDSVKESLYNYVYEVYDFNKFLVDLVVEYTFYFAYSNKFTYEEVLELLNLTLTDLNIYSIYFDSRPIILFDELAPEGFKNITHTEVTLKEEIISQEKSNKFILSLDKITLPFYNIFKKITIDNSKQKDFPMP